MKSFLPGAFVLFVFFQPRDLDPWVYRGQMTQSCAAVYVYHENDFLVGRQIYSGLQAGREAWLVAVDVLRQNWWVCVDLVVLVDMVEGRCSLVLEDRLPAIFAALSMDR